MRFKICCLEDETELALAVASGASAVGFVSRMPSGPGILTDEVIARLATRVPPFVTSVLLTSRIDPDEIAAQARQCAVHAIQLCAPLSLAAWSRVAALLPNVSRIGVVHVEGPAAVAEAEEIAPHVHAVLLDTGVRDGPNRQLGGTGRTHDWTISRRIVDRIATPVILAGGLTSGNVGEAIRTVRPWAVDVCSGVRTEGRLDATKLRQFADAVRDAAEPPA